MKLVSVIIPIFNAQDNIKYLLNDLLLQTFQDVEFLLIDDGSTDKTLKIIKTILDKYNDNRFILIHTKNKGVSSARNLGLLKATGKYVTFIDSDDRIDKNFVSLYYSHIEDTNSDIAVFPIKIVSNNKELSSHNTINYLNKDYISSLELEKNILCGNFGVYLFGFIFLKKVLNNVLFKKDLIYKEDFYYLFRILTKNNNLKISVCHSSCYYYVQNNQGGSTISKPEAAIQSIWVAEKVGKLLDKSLKYDSMDDQLTSILETVNYGLDFKNYKVYNFARKKYIKKFNLSQNRSFKRFVQYILLNMNMKFLLKLIHNYKRKKD